MAICGANGAGKSSLLRLIYRHQAPSKGVVRLMGKDIWQMGAPEAARSLAAVLQEQPTDFALTARQIVALGRLPHRRGWGAGLSTAGAEVARWYAVVILMISYLLWRALQVRGKTLKVVLEALLVGDFVQIGAAIVTANQLGEWPLVVSAALVISIVLAVVRLLCLWQPQLAGIEHVGNTTTDSGSN